MRRRDRASCPQRISLVRSRFWRFLVVVTGPYGRHAPCCSWWGVERRVATLLEGEGIWSIRSGDPAVIMLNIVLSAEPLILLKALLLRLNWHRDRIGWFYRLPQGYNLNFAPELKNLVVLATVWVIQFWRRRFEWVRATGSSCHRNCFTSGFSPKRTVAATV